MNSSTSYGTPSVPPQIPGSIPSRRLPSNTPYTSDPPACVQNAMMTKDKKPFTYTPGGIDLSQIKSPRMAKRIARNAQYEGVTGPAKPSPLAQQNATYPQQQQSAQALGMPVQVFPSGPPPPPPVPSSMAPPPPPPQINRNNLTPQTNGIDGRKSPSLQVFEPPPLGCRPEIKIPPNPMATLKRVPRPREKNDFWIEEYKKERSTSPNPMASSDTNSNAQNEEDSGEQSPVTSTNYAEPTIKQTTTPVTAYNVSQQQSTQSPQHFQNYQPSAEQQYSPTTIYHQTQSPQNRMDSPFHSHDSPSLQRPLSPIRLNQQQQELQYQAQTPVYARTQSQSHPQANSNSPPIHQQQQQQKNSQVGSLYIPPVPQENLITNRQKLQQEEQKSPTPPLQQHLQQQQQQRSIQANNPPTPRWMAQKAPAKEIPEWVRDETSSNSPPSSPVRHVQAPEAPLTIYNNTTVPQSPIQHVQAPQSFINNHSNTSSPSANSVSSPGLRIQVTQKTANSSQPKERIIPIQMEQTPTPTRTPSTPGFGPQPFYNVNQQFNSVTSPTGGSGYTSPTSGHYTPSQTSTTRNPNQFVDQGYNNIPTRWATQNRVTSPPVQQSSSSASTASNGTRIIPIAIEGQDSPFNPNSVRGPINSAPLVIQNGNYRLFVHDCPLEAEIRYRKSRLSDPRALQHQNSWNGGSNQPNQSKSFKILQKLTDTEDNNTTATSTNSSTDQFSSTSSLQRPQYSRQMMTNGNSTNHNSNIQPEQMRRMQINDSSDQAFMNRIKNQVSMQQRLQLPRYAQHFRPEYQQNDQPQPYIHPSEQQVPEPKKYTGSAIPSRSFKILQAMTQPENAGPGQSDL